MAVQTGRPLVLSLFLTVTSFAGVPFFAGLGDLPGGVQRSRANGVSGDGSRTLGQSYSAVGPEALYWQNGVVTSLGIPPGFPGSTAVAASFDGSVIIGNGGFGSPQQAFRWTQSDGFVMLGDLPGGVAESVAFDTSANGQVIVGVGAANTHREAFRWTPDGGMQGIGVLPSNNPYSDARGVSADGSVVVGSSTNSGINPEAIRWENGTLVALGDLPGGSFYSLAHSVSADGRVIVGVGASQMLAGGYSGEAVRWVDGAISSLGDFPGSPLASEALAASGDGSVIVGYGSISVNHVAFIWTEATGMRSLASVLTTEHGLNLSGWSLQEAWGVSDDGLTICGVGFHNGIQEGWVAHIPEPASAAGLIAFALLRRRSIRR